MARLVPLLLPEWFNFSSPDEWFDWKNRFKRYRVASGLSERDGSVQVITLIYAMGHQAGKIFNSFGLNKDDSSKYNTVQERFTERFVKQRNPVYECAPLNQRVQQQGETITLFVTALHSLAEHCK